tara:strand:+ start:3551 stop:5086 length:1536 start_codon:yes stop_codon:yes gene_type:complete
MKILFESVFTINQEIKKLINKEALDSFSNSIYQGDNANYCISLFHDYLIDPNETNKNFLFYMGKKLINWAEKNLHKGYFKMEDVHHGSELFLGFLPRYIDLFPENLKAKELILNVSKLIGNWDKETEDWYNYSLKNFNSWYFGSDGISNKDHYKFNTADHLRFVHIALLAWNITSDQKYLDWSIDYSKQFAERVIIAKEAIPVAWNSEWDEFFSKDMINAEEKFLASNHHHFKDDPFSGIENLIASGFIYVFGELYNITNDKIFLESSKKIIKNLIPVIDHPYSDNVGTIISYYRDTFSDYSFDKLVLDSISNLKPYDDSEIMLTFPQNQTIKRPGLGNRKDMIYWYFFNSFNPKEFREPSTSYFSLLYNITGKIEYAERAFRTAAKKIKIASSILRPGFEHSDSGKHFSSIVSGHGRNWGIGSVTGCYTKLIIGSNENLGKSDYLVKFKSATITAGCLPLIRNLPDNSTELRIFNFSNKINSIKFSYKNKKDTYKEIQPNSEVKIIIKQK